MRYFLAVLQEAAVHIKFPDEIIKVELERDQAFNLYHALENVTLFTDAGDAACYATDNYFSQEIAARKARGESLVQIDYGKHCTNYSPDMFVIRRRQPVTLVYQVEGPEQAELAAHKLPVQVRDNPREAPPIMKTSIAFQLENKNKLELICALVSGVTIFYTEKYAKLDEQPLNQSLKKLPEDNFLMSHCSIL